MQADGRRFNKGMLLNAAFDMLQADGWDSFVFSDVDVLPAPTSELLPWYITPPGEDAVLHFPFWHPNVSGFGAPSGGFIHCGVAMTSSQIRKTNGFPNGFWGWGGEDDALRRRVESAGLSVLRPAIPTDGALRDLEFELLDRRRGGTRASDPACAEVCRCPDKIARHWQHDRGGTAPEAWKEDGVEQLRGGTGYTIEQPWASLVLGDDTGEDSNVDAMVPVMKAVVCLEEISAPAPAPDSDELREWRVPPPTVQCFLAAHPRLERAEWSPCLLPFVPKSMACHWMNPPRRADPVSSAAEPERRRRVGGLC